jgi:serine/threonine protein kinase
MKPTEWIKYLTETEKFEQLDTGKFSQSCMIYAKGTYGIFLIDGRYTVKVKQYFYNDNEILIGLYVDRFASHIPNLLHVIDVFVGDNPITYPLFNTKLTDYRCKDLDSKTVFKNTFGTEYGKYSYYFTDACFYNLNYYLGKNKGTFTYDAFVDFVFGILVGLQTLHHLGILHNDFKAPNILLCESSIKTEYIQYVYQKSENQTPITWTLSYKNMDNRDIKVMDYGDAKVINDVANHCTSFTFEITFALVAVFELMWRFVLDKDEIKEQLYQDLIRRCKTCTTTLLDIMVNAEIFLPIQNINTQSSTHIVNLLH